MEAELIRCALQRLYAGDVSASRELEAFQVSPGALELSVKLLSSSVPEAVDICGSWDDFGINQHESTIETIVKDTMNLICMTDDHPRCLESICFETYFKRPLDDHETRHRFNSSPRPP